MTIPNRFRKGMALQTLALLAIAAIAAAGTGAPAAAVDITQYFPAVPAGQTAPRPQSGWKIRWQVLEPRTHNYGGSAVWEIQSVEFMKGYKADGTEDWIKILNNLALAEMYVPYHDGTTEFFDITQFRFPFVRARQDYIPASGVVRATIHDDRYVIGEVSDDQVRWMDNNANDSVRRGQTLNLWGTFNSGNYRYVIVYSFGDDGLIKVRAGGTAQNLIDLPAGQEEDHATHIHMPAWRMEFDLGNAEANRIEMVERVTDPRTNRPSTLRRPFNGGREGGEVWDPAKFPVLKVTNSQTQNRHRPPRNVGYALKPLRMGSLRNTRPFTASDFWVSRLRPDNAARAVQGPELRFIDVPQNVSAPEALEGKAAVVWYHSSLNHVPRTEDFGAVNFVAEEGVAILSWTGFDLMPVDLWHKTPLLERGG